MATNYGSDIAATTDLPDPEVLVSGETNAAYAQARRLLTPDGALEDIGDASPYASLDLRAVLGKRMAAADVAKLTRDVNTVLKEDPRVTTAFASVAQSGGGLVVTSQSDGANGPFGLVLSVDSVDSATLKVT